MLINFISIWLPGPGLGSGELRMERNKEINKAKPTV
jgi:hypothetical protein